MAKLHSILLLCSLLVVANCGLDAGTAMGGVASMFGTYADLLAKGSCSSYNGNVAIGTFINGADLIANNEPSPVGTSYFKGPRLGYLAEKTKFWHGDWCTKGSTIPMIIPPNCVTSFTVGDVKGGLFSLPEVDLYFQVYNEQGVRTDCLLKVYVDVAYSSNVFRITTAWIRKENPTVCAAQVPNLKLHETGVWCPKNRTDSDGLRCAAVNGVQAFSNAFLVYFDPPTAKSEAASSDEFSGNPSSFKPTFVWAEDKSTDVVAEAPAAASSNNQAPTAASSSKQRIPSLVSAFVVLGFSGIAALVLDARGS